ncbi:helix-turn-helix transcriptional regulator [Yoonia sp. SS1-5]|uniref:Helix-turn-helix domain-containing protein n=1 Tax=Yoonia rhodophyticola TaxID=3137370 RepID=A0AAN0M638_9RHOB
MRQETPEGLGTRIRLTRLRMKRTQKEMAVTLAVCIRTYQRYEDGGSEPPVSLLLDVCKEASVRFEWLVFGTGEPIGLTSTQMTRAIRTLIDQTDQHLDRLRPCKRAAMIVELMDHIQKGAPVSETEIGQSVAAALNFEGTPNAT